MTESAWVGLARRFGARLLGGAEKIEQDDLSLAHNTAIVASREKWPAEKRNEDPLLFSSHPDFVSFPPDGPLRQISIPQMRRLKESAQFIRQWWCRAGAGTHVPGHFVSRDIDVVQIHLQQQSHC